MIVRDVPKVKFVPEEPAIPDCQCADCRKPTSDNFDKRMFHADRHAEFREWYAKRQRRRN